MLRLFLNGLLLAAVHYLFMAPTHTFEHAAEKKASKGEKERNSINNAHRCTLALKRAHITRKTDDGEISGEDVRYNIYGAGLYMKTAAAV